LYVDVGGDSISCVTASFLATIEGKIRLSDLVDVSLDLAERLSQHSGSLSLPKLAIFSPGVRQLLDNHKGDIKVSSDLEEAANRLLTRAQSLNKQCQYDDALATLAEMPAVCRHEKYRTVENDVIGKQRRATKLFGEIKQRIKDKQLDGLLPIVIEARKLMENRKELPVIENQLIERFGPDKGN
jgi:hypothetical protein